MIVKTQKSEKAKDSAGSDASEVDFSVLREFYQTPGQLCLAMLPFQRSSGEYQPRRRCHLCSPGPPQRPAGRRSPPSRRVTHRRPQQLPPRADSVPSCAATTCQLPGLAPSASLHRRPLSPRRSAHPRGLSASHGQAGAGALRWPPAHGSAVLPGTGEGVRRAARRFESWALGVGFSLLLFAFFFLVESFLSRQRPGQRANCPRAPRCHHSWQVSASPLLPQH